MSEYDPVEYDRHLSDKPATQERKQRNLTKEKSGQLSPQHPQHLTAIEVTRPGRDQSRGTCSESYRQLKYRTRNGSLYTPSVIPRSAIGYWALRQKDHRDSEEDHAVQLHHKQV